MRPLDHTRSRRLWRWAFALLVLPPLLLLGSVEALYHYGLSGVGELPRAPPPRRDLPSRVLWASMETGTLQVQPRWSWTIVAEFARATRHPRNRQPPAGANLSWLVARHWLASRSAHERTPMLNWHLRGFALSVWISRHWTAEEVMTAYAEGASFGRGLIGLDAATRWYIGKEPAPLALHQAALLAGLPDAPTRYDPVCRPEASLKRRDFVLSRLRAQGWISEAQYEEARHQPLLPPEVVAREATSCNP